MITVKVRQPTGVWLRPWCAQDDRDRSAWFVLQRRELRARGWALEFESCPADHGHVRFVWLSDPSRWLCAKCAPKPRAWQGGAYSACDRCGVQTPSSEIAILCVYVLVFLAAWSGVVELWVMSEMCDSCWRNELEGA
jgi:hypothetical protein